MTAKAETKPLDGGWGWAVVWAAFVILAVAIGNTYTFGVLIPPLRQAFHKSYFKTSLIGSIQPFLVYLTGVFSGPLLKWYGWRKVTIFGALLSTTGFCASATVNSLYYLYFTYGVLTGIGNGLMYVTSMVCVQHYFDKYRALATGIAVSGSGIGLLAFASFIPILKDKLGWRYTFLCIALIVFVNGVVWGAFYRPLPKVAEEDKDKNERAPLISSQQSSYSSVKSDVIRVSIAEESGCGWWGVFAELFDLSLFKNGGFILLSMAITCFNFGYHVPYTYTTPRAIKVYNIPESTSDFLISIMGIANVVSRLCFGWIADRSQNIRFYMTGVCILGVGVVSCIIFLFTSFKLLVIYCVLFGSFSGSFVALFPVVIVDLFGIEKVSQSIGQAMAVGSFAFLVAGPLCGWIIDVTNSFDAPFQVVGGACIFGSILFFCIKCFHKSKEITQVHSKRPRRKHYISESIS